jgi:hypothetical protein
MYAHSLAEQKIDPIRHKVYTILKNTTDLFDLDLVNDSKLFRALLELTKLCSMCIKKICPGGYNCRNGSINVSLRVCYEDLMYGCCKRNTCTSIHLTERGLTPYYQQKEKRNNSHSTSGFSKYKSNSTNKLKNMLNDISGILLTEKFLLANFNNNNSSESSDDETEEQIEQTKKFLNETEEEDTNSIFTE